MGFASYLEDITTLIEQSFAQIDTLSREIECAPEPDLAKLRSEIACLKRQTHSLLKVLQEQVLELLTNPDFEVYVEWQNTLFENAKFKCQLSQLEATLQQSKKQDLWHKHQIIKEKDKSIKQLESSNQQLRREIKSKTEEVERLRRLVNQAQSQDSFFAFTGKRR